MKYEAFVFDFDGVLADSVEVKTRAFGQIYLPHGEAIAEAVVHYHREHGGTPRREKFRYYEAELLGTPADDARLDELNDQFSALVVDNVVAADEIAGATVFLRHWHGRLPLFVDSASPDVELIEIMKRRGLTGYFNAAYGSNRSKTENLAAIIAEHDFDPKRVLFFGDAMGDLDAATACGTEFVGIVRNEDTPLARIQGLRLFADFNELHHYLSEGV